MDISKTLESKTLDELPLRPDNDLQAIVQLNRKLFWLNVAQAGAVAVLTFMAWQGAKNEIALSKQLDAAMMQNQQIADDKHKGHLP